jgi:hypothetical protein
MRTLTKQAEQKLIAAIEDAANLVNKGMAPNDAIVKSAAAADIPAGHINLMVHAYNTGRTTKQRETGENTLEKAADFRLADADTVLAALYPAEVKTSAELLQQEVVSPEYAVSPAGMLARRKAALRKEAAAAAVLPEKTYVPPPRDEQAAVMRAQSEKRAKHLADEELRRQVYEAQTKAAGALEDLNVYFRTAGSMPYGDALREVELRYGEVGVNVLKKIAAVYPHFEKQKETKEARYGDDPVYKIVEDVIGSVQRYNTAKEAAPSKKADAVCKKAAPEFLTGSVLSALEEPELTLKEADAKNPYGGQSPNRPLPAPEAPALKPVAAKAPAPSRPLSSSMKDLATAAAIGSPHLRAMAGLMGYGGGAEAAGAKSQFETLDDPEHELALQNIRSKAILHDLTLNDPVISGYDPADVAMAFNEVAELAPTLTNTRSLLQTALRKRLEAGQLADFDIKQLMDMAKLRAEQQKAVTEAQRLRMELMQ